MHCPCGNLLKFKQKKFCSIKCRNTANAHSRMNRLTVECVICQKPFQTRAKRIGKYCSASCMGLAKRKQEQRTCLFCKKTFWRKLSEIKRYGGKFCSRKCSAEHKRIWITIICSTCKEQKTNLSHKWSADRKYCSQKCKFIGQNKSFLTNCLKCAKPFKNKPYKFTYGYGKFCSAICKSSYYSGEKHPNWKGGITPENEKIRSSGKYQRWRKAVFERDNYTCQICNIKGGKLEGNHIKRFSLYPELRFDVSNGITLCAPCHYSIRGKEHEWEARFVTLIAMGGQDLTTVDLVS